jgi:hypothetical protein
MAYTRYTPEQLAAMSDNELNEALANMLGHGRVMFGGTECPNYCNDWAVTGALMEDHDVWVFDDSRHEFVAMHKPTTNVEWSLGFQTSVFSTIGPLRAVVECLVLVLQEGE